MALADVVGRVSGELVRRHADDDPVRGSVHHASEPPQMLRQKQPAPPARLRNAERVESKADIDEIEPILVVPRRPPTPGRPPTPPTLEVVEQGPQSVHLGVNAGGRAPARSLVEAPGDDLAGTANYREVVIPGAAAADCFILWNKVDPLFRPVPPPPVGGLSLGPRRRA